MLKKISNLFKPSDVPAPDVVSQQLDEMLDNKKPVSQQLDEMLAELPEPQSIDEMISAVTMSLYSGPIDEDLYPETDDSGYIQHAPEVVGYDSRARQWASFRVIANIIGGDASILDVGCGRGDFKVFYAQEMQLEYADVDYTGVDLNPVLINAGKEIYGDIDLIETNWLNMSGDLKKDWVVNINSLNLRYDDSLTDNWDYFTKTIDVMYNHADIGVAVLLNSSIGDVDVEGLINWSPGDVLNWCQKKYGNVAIDHSFSDDLFTLIIYK